MSAAPKTNKLRIIAYGFDALGFKIPEKPTPTGMNHEIEFLPLQSNGALDSADAAIIPQGIFEKIEYQDSYDGRYTDIQVHRSLLQEREKQVFNLIQEGKWVCFLVGPIVDKVPQGWDEREIGNTDLCKRVLNALEITRHKRRNVDGLTLFETKCDEFRSYLRDYGVANTLFELPYDREQQFRTIAKSESEAVAVDWGNRLFFLPFHTTKRDLVTLNLVATAVSNAVLDYRQKRIVEVPAWVEEFKFENEEKLRIEIESLLGQIAEREGQLQMWRDYKAILSTSGDILKDRVVAILRHFFKLNVDASEEYREDAKIIDNGTKTSAFVEIKGTKGGIKREHINQVDSHRERASLSPSVPGVLVINNEMSVSGIKDRSETKVPAEQIAHAKTLNVLIVRTIDLLFLLRQLENSADRKDRFLKIIQSGGGWLRVTSTDYQVILS